MSEEELSTRLHRALIAQDAELASLRDQLRAAREERGRSEDVS